jgi:hypothetical protein
MHARAGNVSKRAQIIIFPIKAASNTIPINAAKQLIALQAIALWNNACYTPHMQKDVFCILFPNLNPATLETHLCQRTWP